MAFRIIEALIGVALAASGGYLAWINRGSVDGMFPPQPGLSVWTFIGGLIALIVGLVAAVHAMGPRPRARARRAEESERRARVLREAEQFYTAQAEELASPAKDPEKPLFPEGLRPAGAPIQPPVAEPPSTGEQPPRPFQLHSLNQPPAPGGPAPGSHPPEPAEAPQSPEPQFQPQQRTPSPSQEPEPVEAKTPQPEATSAPQVSAAAVAETAVPAEPHTEPALGDTSSQSPVASVSNQHPIPSGTANPFPAAAGVIPKAGEPPPPSLAQPEARPSASSGNAAAAQLAGAPSEFGEIRKAIAENRLVEADRLLSDTRRELNDTNDPKPVALAKLTGLAGDHAAADGRLGSAKWLWRLALQRFAAAGAIDDPAAREVSERMRLADQ